MECEKMRKQIVHLKKENIYTKELLEKSIKSSQDNTATMR